MLAIARDNFLKSRGTFTNKKDEVLDFVSALPIRQMDATRISLFSTGSKFRRQNLTSKFDSRADRVKHL